MKRLSRFLAATAVLLSGALFSSEVLAQSGPGSPPIAHWKLDDATGTLASDASGNGHAGTLVNGPAWTMGSIGGALSFDGVNDFVVVPHHNALNASALTIAGWVWLSAQNANYQMLWQKLEVNDANGYFLYVHPTNDATPSRLEWTGANGATYSSVLSSTALVNNNGTMWPSYSQDR